MQAHEGHAEVKFEILVYSDSVSSWVIQSLQSMSIKALLSISTDYILIYNEKRIL